MRGGALQQQRNSPAKPKMNLLVPATPGCDDSLEGWVGCCCRREFGLALRLGGGVVLSRTGNQPGERVAEPWPGEAAIGTRALAEQGLVVVALGGGYELRSFHSDLPATISFAFSDQAVDEAVAAINELLANRGLPPLQLENVDLGTLPPLTLMVTDLPWQTACAHLAKSCGLRLEVKP